MEGRSAVGWSKGGGGQADCYGALESCCLARVRVVVAPLPLAHPATKFNRHGQKIPNKSPDGLLTGAEGSAYLVSPISYALDRPAFFFVETLISLVYVTRNHWHSMQLIPLFGVHPSF